MLIGLVAGTHLHSRPTPPIVLFQHFLRFYFIFPYILLLGLGSQVARGACCLPSGARMGLLLATTGAASFVTCWFLSRSSADGAFYLLPARFWELAAGVALALLSQMHSFKELLRSAHLSLLLQGMFLVVMAISLSLLRTEQSALSFPFPGAILPVVASLFFIAAGTSANIGLNAMLAADLPVYVGRLSYSIYLWHMPVLAILHWHIIIGNLTPTMSLIARALTPVLVYLLAAATYHLVELPMQELNASNGAVLFVSMGSLASTMLWLRAVWAVRISEVHPRLDELLLGMAFMATLTLVTCQSLEVVRLQPTGRRVLAVVLPSTFLLLMGFGFRGFVGAQTMPGVIGNTTGVILNTSQVIGNTMGATNETQLACVLSPCACRRRPALHVPPCSFEAGDCPELNLPPCFDDQRDASNDGEPWDALPRTARDLEFVSRVCNRGQATVLCQRFPETSFPQRRSLSLSSLAATGMTAATLVSN